MRFEVAVFEEFGNGDLRLCRRGASADVFHVQHPLQVTARCNPTDAQTGRQGFRERAAKEYAAIFVKGLDRARARVAVGQFAIHVVFDDRHIKALGQGQQRAFAGFRHDVAQGVVAVWCQLDDLDRPLLQGQFQCFEADAGERVCWYFQGLHTQALKGLHGTVEAWRVDCDDIPRFANGMNTGGQRFMAARSDDDIFGVELAAGIQRQTGDLLAQFHTAKDVVVIQSGHILATTDPCKTAQQGFQGRRQYIRHASAHLYDIFAGDCANQFQYLVPLGDFYRSLRRAADLGQGWQLAPGGHKVAGFGLGHRQAVIFQQAIGLLNGAQADPVFHTQGPYGRQAIAGAIEALLYASAQHFGEIDVESHGGRSRGTITDTQKIQDSAT